MKNGLSINLEILCDGKEDSYERLLRRACRSATAEGGSWRVDNPGGVSFVFNHKFIELFEVR